MQTLTRSGFERRYAVLSKMERRIEEPAAKLEQERSRRIRDSEVFQAFKVIFRKTNFFEDMKDVARDTRDEVQIYVDRMNASEWAFQSKSNESPQDELKFLFVAEALYKRALNVLDRVGDHVISMKDELAHHIQRSLDAVRADIKEIEDKVLREEFEEARIKACRADLDLMSEEARQAMHRRMTDHKIEKIKYRILMVGCVVGGSVMIASTLIFPIIAPVADFAAGGAYLWGGRMYWKSKSEHVRMMTVKEATQDRINRSDTDSRSTAA